MHLVRLVGFGFCLGVFLVSATASAQSGPPPVAVTQERRMHLDAGAFFGMPSGDLGDDAGLSPGLRIDFGYHLVGGFSLQGLARYILVQPSDDRVSASYWDVGIGARYAQPIAPRLELFGELSLIHATLTAEALGYELNESGGGFGARGGVAHALSPSLALTASASFTTAEDDGYDADWLSLEGAATVRF